MILETHESSPAVDAQTVIMKIMKQAEGGEPPVSFRHGIEPPDEEIVFVTAAGHPYKSAASAARAARTRADLQDIVWEIVSVDGGWVIREIFDYDNWFEYHANKETMTADKIGYMTLVSTADMTRFCRSTVYREWASQLGLGVPVMFGGEGAPLAKGQEDAPTQTLPPHDEPDPETDAENVVPQYDAREVQWDFWTPKQIADFIGIEQAFEEFCEADPELAKLDSTRPDPKRNLKDFKEWHARYHAQYSSVHDAAAERFVEPFREKILVAIALPDDKEDEERVLAPEYWSPSIASLTFTKGTVEGLLLDERHKHLANRRVVLRKEEWKNWKAKQGGSKYEKSQAKRKRDHDAQPSTPTKADQTQTADELKDWFVNVYVPAHKDESPNPTRDAALSAAKAKFTNYCDLTHLRKDLRDIWLHHAPEGWKKTGPRPKPNK